MLGKDSVFHGVEEKISFMDADAMEVTTEDNFIYVNTNNTSFSIGTFIAPGDYTKIRFLVGLKSVINHGDLSGLDDEHTLISSRDSMYLDQTNGYIFYKMVLIRDPFVSVIAEDINISGNENLVLVEIDHEFTVRNGDEVSLKIKADYGKWFDANDLGMAINPIIENIVKMNTTASIFSIIE